MIVLKVKKSFFERKKVENPNYNIKDFEIENLVKTSSLLFKLQ